MSRNISQAGSSQASAGIRLAPQFPYPKEEWPESFCSVIDENLLARSHALESNDPLEPITLPTSIHPTFDFTQDRWLNNSISNSRNHCSVPFLAAYDYGLRLASILLESPAVLRWYARVLGGKVAEQPNLNPAKNRPDLYLTDTPNVTRTNIADTRKFLRDTTPHWWKLSIRLLRRDSDTGDILRSPYAITSNAETWQVNPRHDHPALKNRSRYGVDCELHHSFYNYALKFQKMTLMEKADPAQRALHLRTQLLFAFTLLHEFAHIIENLRCQTIVDDSWTGLDCFIWNADQTRRYKETYCVHLRQGTPSNEWGGVFETDIFGLQLHDELQNKKCTDKKISPYDPIPVLGLCAAGACVGVDDNGAYKTYAQGNNRLVPMEYVRWWFCDDNLKKSDLWNPGQAKGDHLLSNYRCLQLSILNTAPWWEVNVVPPVGSLRPD